MKRFLLVLNLVLIVVAIVLTIRALQPLPRSAAGGAPPARPGSAAPERTAPAEVPLPWAAIDQDRALLIATENLFSEKRIYLEQEAEAAGENPAQPAATAGGEQFQLVGLVRVGEVTCACIEVLSTEPAKPVAAAPPRSPAGVSIRRPAADPARPAPKAEPKGRRGVYVVGDKVGTADHVLVAIEHRAVLLSKPGEAPLRLELKVDEQARLDRRKAAGEAERRKLEQQTKAAEADKAKAAKAEAEPPRRDPPEGEPAPAAAAPARPERTGDAEGAPAAPRDRLRGGANWSGVRGPAGTPANPAGATSTVSPPPGSAGTASPTTPPRRLQPPGVPE
jgi:hypothetical protein